MSTHQEERIQASVRHLSTMNQERDHFSCIYHAHEATQAPTTDDGRRMVASIREAALVSFDAFITDPLQAEEPEAVRSIFYGLQSDFNSWQSGDTPLSHLMNSMNRTLSTGALQAHVTLCERFVSVHNIFSLLQLKQIQMQATQSLARSMNHTSTR